MIKKRKKVHDLGGSQKEEQIALQTSEPEDWELVIDAISGLLRKKGYFLTDELSRAIEAIDPEQYIKMRYYERWSVAIETILIQKHLITEGDIKKQMDLLTSSHKNH